MIKHIMNNHIDFIIGRGRAYPFKNLNIPLNKSFETRNVVYIDCLKENEPDIESLIEEVDFSIYLSTDDIKIRLIFDWSSFYCSAMDNLPKIAQSINVPFETLVPLTSEEDKIPYEVTKFFDKHNDIFTYQLIDGQYPLFDWNKKIENIFYINKQISSYVNPNKYFKIYYH